LLRRLRLGQKASAWACGVDAPLSTSGHALDRGAGAQTVYCGDATLPRQEGNSHQMSGDTFFPLRLSLAQAGVQTVSCGDATLSQQEKNTRQMSGNTFFSTEVVASHHLSTRTIINGYETMPC
jgi:hypothetical protein